MKEKWVEHRRAEYESDSPSNLSITTEGALTYILKKRQIKFTYL